jgi:hypothetical protein
MAKNKEDQIFVQDGETVIELTGAEKEAFIAQRTSDQLDEQARQAKADAVKAAKLSALQKLGLTEEEINAIF